MKIRHFLIAFFITVLTYGVVIAPSEAADGEKIYKKKCKMCHRIKQGVTSRPGPNLFGVVGRVAGTLEGAKYSNEMKNSGITWDEAVLDKFIADPKGLLPAGRMKSKLKGEEDRRAVIEYIKKFK